MTTHIDYAEEAESAERAEAWMQAAELWRQAATAAKDADEPPKVRWSHTAQLERSC